jgi:hypothetical protein
VTRVTQAVLKFAAGDDAARIQLSSTWYMRATRRPELFLLNREAGGERAHISFHRDGRCHYKVLDPATGRGNPIAQWELPTPLEPTGMRRLATVRIPHRGLVLPDGFADPEPDTVLIPPPCEGEAIEVDILLEPGEVPQRAWPGQGADPPTTLVGRFSLYGEAQTPQEGLLHFTAVYTVRPEGEVPVHLSTLPVDRLAGGQVRAVHFDDVTVDGQRLPVLTEMPVGHWR